MEWAEALKVAKEIIKDNEPTTIIGLNQYPSGEWVVRFVEKVEGCESILKEITI